MKTNVQQELNELKRFYLSKLPDKVTAIEEAWKDYTDNPDHEKLQVLYRQMRNLGSSAGTYGYKEVSDIAKKIDKLLRLKQHLDPETKLKATDLIRQLQQACRKLIKL